MKAKRCKVKGCKGPLLAKGLCLFHYGRARRGKPLEEAKRRGLTEKVLVRCTPKLRRWLERTAKRDNVSVSSRAAFLLQSEMDNLIGKSPF